MDLAISQVANFRPPILKSDGIKGGEVVLSTAKISPSDLPNELEIIRNNSEMKYNFEYSVMEPESGLKVVTTNNFSFKYSKVTGRLYFLKFDIADFAVLSRALKQTIRTFEKKRLKDNLKFGLDLALETYKVILNSRKE